MCKEKEIDKLSVPFLKTERAEIQKHAVLTLRSEGQMVRKMVNDWLEKVNKETKNGKVQR